MTSERTRGVMVIATNCQNTAAQWIGEVVHILYSFSLHIYAYVVAYLFFRSKSEYFCSGAFL
jgi:hypothetical protein